MYALRREAAEAPECVCHGNLLGSSSVAEAYLPRERREARGVDLVVELRNVTESVVRPGKKVSFVERRIRRIVNARSVTIGLAVTFVGLALIGGVIIRFVDDENFPSVGVGIWWALQTVTTVGYGDVVPSTFAGRTIGGLVMVIGIAFISFVTAGVTSTLVQRSAREGSEADRAHQEEIAERIVDQLTELGKRLDAIDSKLAG